MTIDVKPFIDKLEVLKEYICLKIDGKGKVWMIDIGCIPWYNPQELIDIYFQTGVLLTSNNESFTPPQEITFEEFYQNKNNQPCT